jgi:hypothetical protein
MNIEQVKNKIAKLTLKKFPTASKAVLEFQKTEADSGLFFENSKFDFKAYQNHLDSFDTIEEFEANLVDTSDFDTIEELTAFFS